MLKECFNDALVCAADVVVSAGQITDHSLGAVRYNGSDWPPCGCLRLHVLRAAARTPVAPIVAAHN